MFFRRAYVMSGVLRDVRTHDHAAGAEQGLYGALAHGNMHDHNPFGP